MAGMHRLSKYALSFILPVLILLLWFWVSEAGFFPPLLLPGPDHVARRAVELLCTGELARHAASSMARVAAGFLISSLCALALAFWLCRSPLLERTLDPLLEALRVVPPLSLIPLLILWLGIDEAPKLAIVVLASFFPIYLSSLSSLKRVLAHYRELAQVLGLSQSEVNRHILFPGSLPEVLTGLRLGFGYAWRALVGSELIAAASGLGYLIEDASALARTDVVMVGILSIALLGTGCDALFRRSAERILTRRSKREPLELPNEASASFLGVPDLPGISIRGLAVRYPNGREPLTNFSLEVLPGRLTAILGRSGCGKTTLLKAVAGLQPKAGGEISFTGKKRPSIGMVFQEPNLLPWKTVRENVELALLRETETRRRAKTAEVLQLVGLLDREGDYPDALSGGQKQRVGFARALAREPEVLLMDEPFGALDALTREELQTESLRILARARMTVLMITHDVREAVRMADEVLILEAGRAAERYPLAMSRPRHLRDAGVVEAEEAILARLLAR